MKFNCTAKKHLHFNYFIKIQKTLLNLRFQTQNTLRIPMKCMESPPERIISVCQPLNYFSPHRTNFLPFESILPSRKTIQSKNVTLQMFWAKFCFKNLSNPSRSEQLHRTSTNLDVAIAQESMRAVANPECKLLFKLQFLPPHGQTVFNTTTKLSED